MNSPTTKLFMGALFMVLAATHCVRGQSRDPMSLADYYQPNQVQKIELEISEQSQRKLLDALPKRVYAPAKFRWRDITLENVGVRFKGNSSSSPRQRHKRSYLIRFDKYQAEQRFLGLQRVSFDNGVQFGSLFSEPIVTEILAELGIVTHRANYAKLYINGRFEGVYVNVERIDETFMANRLGGAGGALYKVDEGGRGSNLQFLGSESEEYRKTFEPKSESAERNFEQLVQLIRIVNSSGPESAERLQSKLKLDEFIKITAVMLYAGAFDQLTGWNPHNYYLVQDATSGRWKYLPWDLDVGFSATAFGKIQVIEDWNAAWPIPRTGGPNPLLEKIVGNPQLLNRYRATAREILQKYFDPVRMNRILDAKYALIREALSNDPFPHRRVTNPTDRSYDDVIRSMKEFSHARYKQALAELDNPGVRPTRHVNGDDPKFPPWVNPSLAKKILRVHKGVRRFEENIRPIHETMQKVGPLIQQRKVEEAEMLVDEALRRIEQIREKK